MPSATLQTRISAFENLSSQSSTTSNSLAKRSPLPPRQTTQFLVNLPSASQPSVATQAAAPHPGVSPSPSPPHLGRKTSLIDLHDWIVDDGPSPLATKPAGDSITSYNGNTSPKPGNNQQKSTRTLTERPASKTPPAANDAPLINLGSPPRPKPKPPNLSAPPLPPRKPSYTSLKSFASTSSLLSVSPPSIASVSPTASPSSFLYPPRRTDSLSVDYPNPQCSPRLDSESRTRNGSAHAPASSISSFHSVSLSSDTDPGTPGSMSNHIATYPLDHLERTGETDSASLTESYEDVSTASFSSPLTERSISLDWDAAITKPNNVPPKLPQRPPSANAPSRSGVKSAPPRPPPRKSLSSSQPNSPNIKSAPSVYSLANPVPPNRRMPPPPPSRSSDRSSIRSTITTHSVGSSSSHSHSHETSFLTRRPAPMPLNVHKRYERVFIANIIQRRRAENRKSEEKNALLSPTGGRNRRAAGWRGLSVDLIVTADPLEVNGVNGTNSIGSIEDDFVEVDEEVKVGERLEGAIVRRIWLRSGLERSRLGEIWSECDPSGLGSLDVDAFMKGMWRIDEELRRSQAWPGSSSSRSKDIKNAFRASAQKPRDILR